MLDPIQLRNAPHELAERLRVTRGFELDVAHVEALEVSRKQMQIRTQDLQNLRNTRSKQIGMLKAKGEVSRFNELLPQYQAAPELTRQRLFLETMEEIYSKNKKVYVDLPQGTNSVIYLPLDKMDSQGNRSASPKVPTTVTAPAASQTPAVVPQNAGDLNSDNMGQASVPLRSSDRSSGRY